MQKAKIIGVQGKPSRYDDIDLHNKIEVLNKPNKYEDFNLHNKATYKYIKKKFLANLDDYLVIAKVLLKSDKSISASVDVDDLEEQIASESKFIKLQVIQTLIKLKLPRHFLSDNPFALFEEAEWIDGMFDYHTGIILNYRFVTKYLNKEDIKAITLDEENE